MGAAKSGRIPEITDRALQDAGGWNDPKTPKDTGAASREGGEAQAGQPNTPGNVPEDRAGLGSPKWLKMVGDVGIEPTTS